jgi:D-alanyl-D-alanine carboxypeptidase
MNETAQHLGMRRTNFANVSGLPDERQVTTARDLAKLASAIIIAFPDHADLFTTVQVQVGKQIMRTPCKVSGKVSRKGGWKKRSTVSTGAN